MTAEHISKDISYRKPFGAVPKGTQVMLTFRFTASGDGLEDEAYLKKHIPDLILRREAVKAVEYTAVKPCAVRQTEDPGVYITEYKLTSEMLSEAGVYFYYIDGVNIIYDPRQHEAEAERHEYQITVYEPELDVPEWFLDTVIYQIFPDRFYRAEDKRSAPKSGSFMYSSWYDTPMYIKNELGEIERWEFFGGNLKGISEKLEYIKSLGAGTVYLNPIFEARSNHRYDTADYMHIDGLLGGDGAFDELIENAREKNIHVILDGVFNHTGRHSKYFKEHKEWYTFRDDGTYECWWGVRDLPAIKRNSPGYMDFIARSADSVIKKWSGKGISGWRLDVADELSDYFIKEIRKAAESVRSDSVIIGEVWEDASNKISYGERRMYFTEKELHTHTNYVFRNTVISFLNGSTASYETSLVFETIKENYPPHNYYAQINMTGSHDVERLMSVMLNISKNDTNLGRNLVKCFSLIQFSSPGVPLIYYGDETCALGGTDPDNRRTYPWGKEDKDMIEWFSSLALARRENPGLVKGGAAYPYSGDSNIFVILRTPCVHDSAFYITVCDRFGRGKEILVKYLNKIITGIDNSSEKSYHIIKQAGGYALLAKLEVCSEYGKYKN